MKYTARMEEELDEIEDGQDSTGASPWRSSTSSFRKIWSTPKRNMTDIKRMEKPTDQVCEKCGKPMVIKWGRTAASSPAPDIPSARILAN